MFRLMHISDLHRSRTSPISNDELISGLVSDQERFLTEDPPIGNPDAIIVSGDLVQGLPVGDPTYPEGLEEQYEEALDLLVRLADQFTDGDRSRVVIVPGNHDVDWNIAFSAMAVEKADNVRKLLSVANTDYRWDWEDLKLYKVVDRALYENRFNYFAQMYEMFYEPAPLSFAVDAHRYWNAFELDGGRVLVCAFNSCSNNDCFSFYGEIPLAAISQSYLERPLSSRQKLKIAVWHHSVQGPPQDSDYMGSDTIRIMIDRGFRLGLHGHQHKSDASPFSFHSSNTERMALISAGSLCADRKELPMGFYRQYNIIEINDSYLSARVHVREMRVRGVFSPSRLTALGGTSFEDLAWTAVSHQPGLVNTGQGGGMLLSDVERIEASIKAGAIDEAIVEINERATELQHYGRQLLSKAFFASENWQSLKTLLSEPENEEELSLVIRAFIELRQWPDAEGLLQKEEHSKRFDEKLLQRLAAWVAAERRARS